MIWLSMMCFYILGIFYLHFNDLAFDAANPSLFISLFKGICLLGLSESSLVLYFRWILFLLFFNFISFFSLFFHGVCLKSFLFSFFFHFIFVSFYFYEISVYLSKNSVFLILLSSELSFSFTNFFFPTFVCHRWYFVLAAFTFFPNWFPTKKSIWGGSFLQFSSD
jgi:hypothetical protein